jgi:hypothetical protein
MAAASIFHHLKLFFIPETGVPEEHVDLHAAVSERAARVRELRACLKTDPALETKINAVTSELLGGVEEREEDVD